MATDLVDRLVELVAIPSVSRNEEAITGSIETLITTRRPSWPIRRVRNNLVVGPVRTGGEGVRKPVVGLVGHTDTVPAQGNAEPEVRGDAVWGVGATDMKGGVAIMCDLLETLPDGELPYDLMFLFYDREELGFDENGLGIVLEEMPVVSEIDFAFVLEPTEAMVELGCNGHLIADVTFRGKSAHSARPWSGANAVHKAAGFISAIAGFEMKEWTVGEASYRETLQITEARGGIARNVVPDSFFVRVSYRFPPLRTPDEAIAFVKGLVPEGAGFEVHDMSPPAPVPRENTIYQAFLAHASPAIRGKQGWTDVARLAMAGVDAVNYGPGIPDLCHHTEEHCPIEYLRKVRDVLYNFLTP